MLSEARCACNSPQSFAHAQRSQYNCVFLFGEFGQAMLAEEVFNHSAVKLFLNTRKKEKLLHLSVCLWSPAVICQLWHGGTFFSAYKIILAKNNNTHHHYHNHSHLFKNVMEHVGLCWTLASSVFEIRELKVIIVSQALKSVEQLNNLVSLLLHNICT